MCRRIITPFLRPILCSVLDVLYPPLCYHCDRRLSTALNLICPACRQQIIAFNGKPDEALAGRSFENIFILFEYGPVVRVLIHLLKYKRYLGLCTLFAKEAKQRFPSLATANYTAIVPVPLYKVKQRERGYNQSEVLARAIAHEFDLHLISDCLYRLRNTPSQTQKSKQQREENMKGAFACSRSLHLQKILLIDDVVTTGSTIESCIDTMKKAGAESIDVFAISHPLGTA